MPGGDGTREDRGELSLSGGAQLEDEELDTAQPGARQRGPRRVTGTLVRSNRGVQGKKSRVPEGSQSLNPLGGSGKGSGVLTAPSLQEGSLRPASSQPAQILPVRGDGDSGTGGSRSPAGACGAS